MKDVIEQDCPLCDSAATYYGVDHDNLKYFDCPKCSCYLVSKRAESLVVSGSPERRQSFAKSAPLAPEGQVFLIRIPSPPSDPSVPRQEVDGSFAPKSDFRL